MTLPPASPPADSEASRAGARGSPASVLAMPGQVSRILALRLRPGEELLGTLKALILSEKLEAGAIVSAVGSLAAARLRFAGAGEASGIAGPLEIVALSGTLGPDGVHVHLAVSDAQGQCYGGHLLAGCVVHTTLELVVAQLSGLRFERHPDSETGYRELRITVPGDPA